MIVDSSPDLKKKIDFNPKSSYSSSNTKTVNSTNTTNIVNLKHMSLLKKNQSSSSLTVFSQKSSQTKFYHTPQGTRVP